MRLVLIPDFLNLRVWDNFRRILEWANFVDNVIDGGGGDITAAGKALLDDANAAAQRTTLGLGTAAVQNEAFFALAAHNHDASNITTGTVAPDRLGSGSPDVTKVLYGDSVYRVPPGGHDPVTVLDTATINFGLTGQEVTGSVTCVNSVVAGGSGVRLVGDAETPGNSQYYGTDGTGTKGYYALPTGSAEKADSIEVNLGSTPKFGGSFTIVDVKIFDTSIVMVWQAAGPYTGKGVSIDEAIAQPVNVVATVPSAGSATVYWETPVVLAATLDVDVQGRGNPAGATFDRLSNQRLPIRLINRRIGGIRGNVIFHYLIV